MTKLELKNLYSLLCSPDVATRRLAFKISEGRGLIDVELMELLWNEFKFNIIGKHFIFILNLGEYKIKMSKSEVWIIYSGVFWGVDGVGKLEAFDHMIDELKNPFM